MDTLRRALKQYAPIFSSNSLMLTSTKLIVGATEQEPAEGRAADAGSLNAFSVVTTETQSMISEGRLPLC